MKVPSIDDIFVQFLALKERIRRLENGSADSITQDFPTSSGTLDVTVPEGARLVVMDFELVASGSADVYLRPNGNSSNIVNDQHFTSSTIAAGAGTGITHSSVQGANPGLRVAAATGGTLLTAAGRVSVQTRADASWRRGSQCDVVIVSSSRPGNFYTYQWRAGCAIDEVIGLSAAITSLRFFASTGNFSGGCVLARFI